MSDFWNLIDDEDDNLPQRPQAKPTPGPKPEPTPASEPVQPQFAAAESFDDSEDAVFEEVTSKPTPIEEAAAQDDSSRRKRVFLILGLFAVLLFIVIALGSSKDTSQPSVGNSPEVPAATSPDAPAKTDEKETKEDSTVAKTLTEDEIKAKEEAQSPRRKGGVQASTDIPTEEQKAAAKAVVDKAAVGIRSLDAAKQISEDNALTAKRLQAKTGLKVVEGTSNEIGVVGIVYIPNNSIMISSAAGKIRLPVFKTQELKNPVQPFTRTRARAKVPSSSLKREETNKETEKPKPDTNLLDN